jgi:hypothetical protein
MVRFVLKANLHEFSKIHKDQMKIHSWLNDTCGSFGHMQYLCPQEQQYL